MSKTKECMVGINKQYVPTVTFTIKGRFYNTHTFPSLNDYIRFIGTNPKAGGRFKKKYMDIAMAFIRKDLRQYKVSKPVIIHYYCYENESGHKRDVMNVVSYADKVIEDALVKLGVLPDDNPRWVKNTTHDIIYTRGEPFIDVVLEELDEKEIEDGD